MSLFQPILDGLGSDDAFNEEEYTKILNRLNSTGVGEFVTFLQTILCTYNATNDFLIKCLFIANKERDLFGT